MRRTFPKNIEIDLRFQDDVPPVVGDSTQLHQVLLNLCVNARDAMPNGGHLVLDADYCDIDDAYASSIPDALPGEYVRIRVRDTGLGMPADVIERIFEPFYTTKGPDKGTGLGLSTALGIVRSHSGFVRVYSEPGEGSTFAVYLPVDPEASALEPTCERLRPFRGHGDSVLLIDDEPDVLSVGRTVLEHLNFAPLVAQDGVEGLSAVMTKRGEIGVVIVDIHMPHLDGVGFVRALRRVDPRVPIVAMSGRFDVSAREELENLGVRAFLAKPFTEAELATALQQALEGGMTRAA
jgi:CheY-like chemotaxis protein